MSATQDDSALLAALTAVQATLQTGQRPDLTADLAGLTELDSLLDELADLHRFARAISQGDLDQSLAAKGSMAGALKTLHSALRHLTWQTQRVAAGDFGQRVDFMGEFSQAFNSMVVALDQARNELAHQVGFLGQLLEAIPAPVFFKDIGQVYRGCNTAFEAFLGRPREEIVDKTVFEVAPPKLAQRYFEQDQALLDNPGVQVYEAEVQTSRGRRAVVFHKATYVDGEGELAGLVGVILDVTDRRRAEDGLRDALDQMRALSQTTELERQRLDLVLELTDDAVLLVDAEGTITFSNPAVRRLNEAMGVHDPPASLAEYPDHYEIRSADEHPMALDEFVPARVFAGDVVSELEIQLSPRAGGDQRIVLVSALPVRDAQGVVLQVVVTIRDVTERKRSEDLLQRTLDSLERSHRELLEVASHDSLTGLLNRRRFEEELERQLAEQQRLGHGGALIWLDLDHFKDVNDTLGHRAGDDLLVLVAQTLREQMRRYSVIARLGGDEFVMLTPGAPEAEALATARRLLRVFATSEFVVAEHTTHVAVSIGVALYPEHGTTVQGLLTAADVAMYHAKESGRAQVSLYKPEQVWTGESASRTLWGERIRAALAKNRLVLHAQPIRGFSSQRTAEYELLLRMIGDDGELIAPLEFIPAAERLGLIGEIDRWVVRQAIHLLADEEAAGEPTRICINLSGRTLSDEHIIEVFRDEFASTGADPERLTVEITETAVVSNIAEASSLVRELHQLGCRFSMDDFGTGASSFNYLRHLPVDVLKIDGSLIQGLGAGPTDEHLVRAIVQMCEALHIASVAEYVENNAVLAEVRDAGVDCAQGYSVGKPEPLGVYLKSRGRSG